MPPPITHTFFAHRLYRKWFPGVNLRALVVGTNFPDIRNISGHPRDHTHDREITAADVVSAQDDPFMMGFKLHSYVDGLHWRIINEAGAAADYYDKERILSVSWKIAEDELLHAQLPDKQTVVSFFGDILEDECVFDIDESVIERWHYHVRGYLRLVPSEKNTHERLDALGVQALGIPGGRGDAILRAIPQFREDKRLHGFVDEAISLFDRELAAA